MACLVIEFFARLRDLVLGVEDFVCVHDPAASIEVRECFVIVACIDVQDASIEVEVFLVEDVLFVVVCLFRFLSVGLFIGNICSLRCV